MGPLNTNVLTTHEPLTPQVVLVFLLSLEDIPSCVTSRYPIIQSHKDYFLSNSVLKNQLLVRNFNMILSKGTFKGKFHSIQISLYILFLLKPYDQMRFDSFDPGRTSENSHVELTSSPSNLIFPLERD